MHICTHRAHSYSYMYTAWLSQYLNVHIVTHVEMMMMIIIMLKIYQLKDKDKGNNYAIHNCIASYYHFYSTVAVALFNINSYTCCHWYRVVSCVVYNGKNGKICLLI